MTAALLQSEIERPAHSRAFFVLRGRLHGLGGNREPMPNPDQPHLPSCAFETAGASAQAATQRSRSFIFCRICSSENPSAKKHSATSPGIPLVRPSLRTEATSAV